jgi:hypothetical protein
VALPPFLLLDDSYTDVQLFTNLIARIGLVNPVRPIGTVAEAQRYLAAAGPSALPVVIFSGGSISDGDELFSWMGEQDALRAIPTVTLTKPLEMYAVMAGLKALALPERARIDTTTLTVRVELWPHGTILPDS